MPARLWHSRMFPFRRTRPRARTIVLNLFCSIRRTDSFEVLEGCGSYELHVIAPSELDGFRRENGTERLQSRDRAATRPLCQVNKLFE
jgi:hypothetical protein